MERRELRVLKELGRKRACEALSPWPPSVARVAWVAVAGKGAVADGGIMRADGGRVRTGEEQDE